MFSARSNNHASGTPLPLIVATFCERAMAIPRSKELFGRLSVNESIERSLVTAFPALAQHPKLTLKIMAPGMKQSAEVLPALWPQIYATVTEMTVEVPLSPEEERLDELTRVGTSEIVAITGTNSYTLNVNLLMATGLDLKMLIRSLTLVPVEKQNLNRHGHAPFSKMVPIRDDETLYDAGIRGADSVDETRQGVGPNVALMTLKPKERPATRDVVVKSG
ncbi:unnamed protein product [Peniophora sp. CBMAI 1063]|nr:unnamed protein product [Peniophora sp. CBMAI 1063]